ncbi:3-oxoacyl-[acyl-carrier-protein] reductase FabG [Tsuneonella dongtanensis]|uniref:3-oxoacyl-[acyl-carrier-protein] reductase FabG n=1 Tax=Tsuneonella dongtanensis TaxID=692370 RepID=A0A1B2ADW7_9SPHN|nr:glucose 1-dehydrogenase [Tsuneonella dongtanensis]ANY20235.1 3-oxoacyl-[acyl-carrier-protein] reductase FabG [Tsuneonella dongtanensis]
MGRLTNKVAIVTGGSRDIGRAVSVALAREGAAVVVNYLHDEDAASDTVADIVGAGGTAKAVRGDMTLPTDVDSLVAEARSEYGETIHILVNVTGGMVERRTLERMDLDFLEHVMRLNLTSTFLATKAVVPHMPAGGAIVNFASQAGRDGGGPGASAYATSKAAVMTFTRAMAKELGPQGIRVNALCPGMIATTFHDTFTKDEVRANVAAATPLRRQGDAREPADAVVFLASDESSFITGANVDINGGMFFS